MRRTESARVPPAEQPPDVSAVATLHLRPGLSTIKAAVRTDDGLVGSVFLDVDVPKLNDQLALSDIEVATLDARTLVVGKPPAFLTRSLHGPPTTTRTFNDGDTIAFYGQVYAKNDEQTATALYTVRDATGRLQRRSALWLQPIAEGPGATTGHSAIPAGSTSAGLRPGSYTLNVEAADAEGYTAVKRIAFDVSASSGSHQNVH